MFDKPTAENILRKIAIDKENGIFAFNAEMILNVWQKGELKVY